MERGSVTVTAREDETVSMESHCPGGRVVCISIQQTNSIIDINWAPGSALPAA